MYSNYWLVFTRMAANETRHYTAERKPIPLSCILSPVPWSFGLPCHAMPCHAHFVPCPLQSSVLTGLPLCPARASIAPVSRRMASSAFSLPSFLGSRIIRMIPAPLPRITSPSSSSSFPRPSLPPSNRSRPLLPSDRRKSFLDNLECGLTVSAAGRRLKKPWSHRGARHHSTYLPPPLPCPALPGRQLTAARLLGRFPVKRSTKYLGTVVNSIPRDPTRLSLSVLRCAALSRRIKVCPSRLPHNCCAFRRRQCPRPRRATLPTQPAAQRGGPSPSPRATTSTSRFPRPQ